MPVRRIVSVALSGALLAACAPATTGTGPADTPSRAETIETTGTTEPARALPAGWRWESFGGV
ncbi:MAG TPA: hypothetical protein VFV40_05640, partial [Nocardioides sp.]|nr:hypothetical protein [Nocardioides sp.]